MSPHWSHVLPCVLLFGLAVSALVTDDNDCTWGDCANETAVVAVHESTDNHQQRGRSTNTTSLGLEDDVTMQHREQVQSRGTVSEEEAKKKNDCSEVEEMKLVIMEWELSYAENFNERIKLKHDLETLQSKADWMERQNGLLRKELDELQAKVGVERGETMRELGELKNKSRMESQRVDRKLEELVTARDSCDEKLRKEGNQRAAAAAKSNEELCENHQPSLELNSTQSSIELANCSLRLEESEIKSESLQRSLLSLELERREFSQLQLATQQARDELSTRLESCLANTKHAAEGENSVRLSNCRLRLQITEEERRSCVVTRSTLDTQLRRLEEVRSENSRVSRENEALRRQLVEVEAAAHSHNRTLEATVQRCNAQLVNVTTSLRDKLSVLEHTKADLVIQMYDLLKAKEAMGKELQNCVMTSNQVMMRVMQNDKELNQECDNDVTCS